LGLNIGVGHAQKEKVCRMLKAEGLDYSLVGVPDPLAWDAGGLTRTGTKSALTAFRTARQTVNP